MVINQNDRIAIQMLRDVGFGKPQIALILVLNTLVLKTSTVELAKYLVGTYNDIKELDR